MKKFVIFALMLSVSFLFGCTKPAEKKEGEKTGTTTEKKEGSETKTETKTEGETKTEK